MDKLISVIVPAYNTEKYLGECINSLLAQTYGNLEIILVNDGSTDGSGALCDEFAARDNRVRAIHQENGGLSAARNSGMDIAQGEYLCFVDSDDWVAPVMYERLYSVLIETGADISMCRCHRFIEGEMFPEPLHGTPQVLTPYEALRQTLGPSGADFNYAWNKLYRRDILEGIRFPAGKLNEDAFVAYRALHRADKITTIPDRLYYYRTQDSSITHSERYALTRDIYEVVAERMALFESEGWTELVSESKREMLDWHIHRYVMGKHRLLNDREAWRRHVSTYRSYYTEYKKEANRMKYIIFAACPNLFVLLSNAKNRLRKSKND